MNDVKFKSNYGYADGSPFHMVMVARAAGLVKADAAAPVEYEEVIGPYPTLDEATAMAGLQAAAHYGQDVYVLSPVRVIRTSGDLVGEHFEPSRTPRDRVLPEPPPCPPPSQRAVDDEPL